MTITRKLSAVAAAATMVLGAAPAFAETSLQGSASAVVDAVAQGYGIGGNASANAEVNANANARTNASSTTGLGASIKALLNGAQDDAATSSDQSAAGSSTVRGNEKGAVVLITRADLDNNGATSVTVTLPSQVRTSDDLKSYVSTEVKGDEHVQAVESASDKVSVTYKQHAKFLGFIPVMLNARADVDAAGNVTIRYPWYSIFTVTDRATLESRVQTSVNAALGTDGSSGSVANGSASLSAQEQAEVVAAVRGAMKDAFSAAADTSVDASADADASVSTD
jgi:hypothetical protein